MRPVELRQIKQRRRLSKYNAPLIKSRLTFSDQTSPIPLHSDSLLLQPGLLLPQLCSSAVAIFPALCPTGSGRVRSPGDALCLSSFWTCCQGNRPVDAIEISGWTRPLPSEFSVQGSRSVCLRMLALLQ